MNIHELSSAQKYQIVKADYDGISDWYDQSFDGAAEFKAQIDDFISTLPEHANIYDIGAGTGKESALLSQFASVTAIDISPSMLAILKKKNPHIATREANMTALPFPDGSADGIWTARAIIHVPVDDLPGAIGEFKRVLKPNRTLGMVFLLASGNEIEEQLLDEPGSPQGEQLFYYRNLYPLPLMASHLEHQGFSIARQEVFADRDGEKVGYIRASRN